MLWYKRSENKQLQLLGYLNSKFPYPEDSLKAKIELHGDGNNEGKLTIKNLQPDDSAVYFCAVRLDTVLQDSVIYDKNLLLQSSTNLPHAVCFQTTCSTTAIKLHYRHDLWFCNLVLDIYLHLDNWNKAWGHTLLLELSLSWIHAFWTIKLSCFNAKFSFVFFFFFTFYSKENIFEEKYLQVQVSTVYSE